MKARYPGNFCVRCGDAIYVQERIVPHGDGFVHEGCAPGGDDE